MSEGLLCTPMLLLQPIKVLCLLAFLKMLLDVSLLVLPSLIMVALVTVKSVDTNPEKLSVL